jgi:hypothetical protein
LWRGDWENHHSIRHGRTCGRDADEPRHHCSSDIPRNPARSVSRHEYLLDEYKHAPRGSPSRIAGDPFAWLKAAELSKSILEIEIGPGSNVATGVAQIAGCRFWPRQERRPVYSTSSITSLMASIPRASKGQTDTCSMTAAADTLDKRRSARAQRRGGP